VSDVFDSKKRSWIMSRVKNRDTAPEKIVRSLIHRMGFRFRLHSIRLPGKPDIVLQRHKKVVMVHGCFWHGHEGCGRGNQPSSNKEFWAEKIRKNRSRDSEVRKQLELLGWSVLTVWQCETRAKASEQLEQRIRGFLGKR